MVGSKPEVLLEGLAFPECPRWRDGDLFFSEKRAHRILRMDEAGRAETVVELDDEPGGIGWLPDVALAIVAQVSRRLVRYDGDGVSEIADLRALTAGKCNDMVVDSRGRAYVGHFGYDLKGGTPKLASLVLVTPEGEARVAAEDLDFPNGSEFIDDERVLIVAESGAQRLTAFDVGQDGSLSGRRVWADLAPMVADGLCIDAEGAVWFADPLVGQVVRVREGGDVTDQISMDGPAAFACALGGNDGRTLFICTDDQAAALQSVPSKNGTIQGIRVDVPSLEHA